MKRFARSRQAGRESCRSTKPTTRQCSAAWSPIHRSSTTGWLPLSNSFKRKRRRVVPLNEVLRKVEEAVAAAQSVLAAAQQEAAGLQSKVDALTAESNQLTQSRAASDAERTNATTTLAQVQSAHSLVGESLRHMTEALAALPGDVELTAFRTNSPSAAKRSKSAAELQTKITNRRRQY